MWGQFIDTLSHTKCVCMYICMCVYVCAGGGGVYCAADAAPAHVSGPDLSVFNEGG
eukprot:m.1171302 g.1171302  ORF g.1171302 m.1171302 type:complete len:56 (+) comp24514_c0_seq3:3042-3209(+)